MRILFSLRRSGGGFEADSFEKLIQIIDDTLVEAIKLGCLLLKFRSP